MKYMAKFVAVVVSIVVFAMPAAAMPLHCTLKVPSSETPSPCHMTGMNSSTDPAMVDSTPPDYSCCEVSAAKPESLTAPQSPSGKEILPQPTMSALLSDLATTLVLRELPDSTVPSPVGPPQAVLCTFLI
jgi:hypothetical protein